MIPQQPLESILMVNKQQKNRSNHVNVQGLFTSMKEAVGFCEGMTNSKSIYYQTLVIVSWYNNLRQKWKSVSMFCKIINLLQLDLTLE